MQVHNKTEKSVREMLEELRENHIDIIPIIREELSQIIPSYAEEIIRNVYGKILAGRE